MAKRRVGKYPEAFRRMAQERMKNCTSVSALAEELGVHRTVLYHWQRQSEAGDEGAQSKATSPVRELRKQIRDLKRLLAEKTLEVHREMCRSNAAAATPSIRSSGVGRHTPTLDARRKQGSRVRRGSTRNWVQIPDISAGAPAPNREPAQRRSCTSMVPSMMPAPEK